MNSNLPQICSESGGGGRHCLVTCSYGGKFLTNSRWTFMGLVLRCGFRLDPRTHRPNWRAALEESCWSSPSVTIRFLVREVLQGPSTAIAQSVWWPAPGRVLVVSAVLPLNAEPPMLQTFLCILPQIWTSGQYCHRGLSLDSTSVL